MVTAYQKFYEAIRENATRKTYEIYLNQFLKYSHKNHENLAKLSQSEIEELVFNYVIHLKDLTERTGKPNPNSYNTMTSPIKLFLEMNDILLNWIKIKRYFPSKVPVSNQLPYTDNDVKELLAATTSIRNKAFIHFLAATGCRVGAIPGLEIEDVKQIEEGAIVTMYKDTTEEYKTCLTPESYYHLKKYLAQRLNTNVDSPLFTTKNNVNSLSLDAAGDVIRHIRRQVKLEVDHGRKSTKGKSQNHAFRKRFSLCLANADIQSKFIEYMMGHYEKQDRHYFKPSDEDLWFQYKKAIKILTLDKSEAMKHELEQKKIIIDDYEKRLQEKVSEIENRYEGVIGALEIEVWVAKMKKFFLDQLEGRGHTHVDKKYISDMRDFVDASTSSDALKVFGGDNELVNFMKNWESLAKNKVK
ncbi:MAG: site-specific integrase [Thaumarchaeota archaeon]|jgi:integrase/recombinase XerD|nr:site-specific integrase [Nitrososphaerota archaeon]MBT5842095.1 site-specific integrase [Nitrososphaerota archaeon]MBT6468350.1 site-specific integrase [Nitrososphaerota archaeon]